MARGNLIAWSRIRLAAAAALPRRKGKPLLEDDRLRQTLFDFEARYGRGGEIDLYFAPGRVNIIGEHTDYNGGLVLPMAIEQGTYVFIRGSELPPARLYSANLNREARFHPNDINKAGDWADYVRGVFLYARRRCPELPPFDGIYFGDLPLGAGLSSSASIEIATALAMNSIGCTVGSEEAVKLGRRSENDFVGVTCGVMDQFAVAFAREGHALLLNCDTMDYRHVPCNIKDAVLVVGHTGVYRSLTDTPYNTRRRECEDALDAFTAKLGRKMNLSQITVPEFERARWTIPGLLVNRAEHAIFENIRVEEAARCLERGDAEELGHLMNRSHESLRDLFEVSSPELDKLQELSVNHPGVLGCRMTGAGFGGCVVTLLRQDALRDYLRNVPGEYWEATHYEPEFIVTAPCGGARKLQVAG